MSLTWHTDAIKSDGIMFRHFAVRLVLCTVINFVYYTASEHSVQQYMEMPQLVGNAYVTLLLAVFGHSSIITLVAQA